MQLIFPEGTPHRTACISDLAAMTIFVMLYLGAAEGKEEWIRPDQVTRIRGPGEDDAHLLARWLVEAWQRRQSLQVDRSQHAIADE
jgi:hypothetical protein